MGIRRKWQIGAFWRFQILESMRQRYGYPEITATGAADIPGYKPVPADFEQRMSNELKTIMELPNDSLAQFRRKYRELGAAPGLNRYG